MHMNVKRDKWGSDLYAFRYWAGQKGTQKIASDKYHRNYGALLWLGVITGLRWVDLHQLKLYNLELDSENGRCMVIGTAYKTNKTYDKVIPPQLFELMYEIAEEGEGDEGLIFHNNGQKYSAQWMRDRSKTISEMFMRKLPSSLKGAVKGWLLVSIALERLMAWRNTSIKEWTLLDSRCSTKIRATHAST